MGEQLGIDPHVLYTDYSQIDIDNLPDLYDPDADGWNPDNPDSSNQDFDSPEDGSPDTDDPDAGE